MFPGEIGQWRKADDLYRERTASGSRIIDKIGTKIDTKIDKYESHEKSYL